MVQAKQLRRRFYQALITSLPIVWPIFSLLLSVMLGLGLLVAYIESWALVDGIYFACITGLTVGYGDLVPHHGLSRLIAIAIGFLGVLLTALFAAISVRALQMAVQEAPQAPITEN